MNIHHRHERLWGKWRVVAMDKTGQSAMVIGRGYRWRFQAMQAADRLNGEPIWLNGLILAIALLFVAGVACLS